ncbi:MAG: CpsD/CapB family tyrosine-protein kinase [Armatimonas sp.]
MRTSSRKTASTTTVTPEPPAALSVGVRFERNHDTLAKLGEVADALPMLSIRFADILNHPVFQLEGPVIVGVTSAVAGEGVTSVALQLAATLTRSDVRHVCLMDFNLANDDLAGRVSLPQAPGLNAVLENSETTIHSYGCAELEDLQIITSGKPAANPARASRGPRAEQILTLARERFDVTIVELPPLATGDAPPLVDHLDGVIVVVCAGVTPKDLVATALARLDPQKRIGVVLNRIQVAGPRWLVRKFAPWW